MDIQDNSELLRELLNIQQVQQQSKRLLTVYFQNITVMPVDLIVLLYVAEYPHSNTKTVAAECHLNRSRVSASVSRMAYSGWLQSRANLKDRRLIDLTLTSQGYTELATMRVELQRNIKCVENQQQLTMLINDLMAAKRELKKI